MTFRTGHIAITGALALSVAASAHAQRQEAFDFMSMRGPDPASVYNDIVIDQRLDEQVPLDLEFLNEHGNPVRLGDYVGDRPVILSLGYFRCPMTCDAQLNALAICVDAMKYDIGKDFDIVSVSFDPKDTPETAAAKKANYMELLHRDGGAAGWHFLTTEDEDTIDTLTDVVGYHYIYDPVSDQYAHASGIMVLTPTGKLSRYYYGLEYIPRDLQFGLVEASGGKIGSLVDRVTVLCFQYDPSTGKYTLLVYRIVQIAGALTVAAILLMYLLLYLRSRRHSDAHGDAPGNPKIGAAPENKPA